MQGCVSMYHNYKFGIAVGWKSPLLEAERTLYISVSFLTLSSLEFHKIITRYVTVCCVRPTKKKV